MSIDSFVIEALKAIAMRSQENTETMEHSTAVNDRNDMIILARNTLADLGFSRNAIWNLK